MAMKQAKLYRRDLLTVAGGLGAGASLTASPAAAAAPEANRIGEFNVLDFGAKGDGTTDNTSSFQKALVAAGEIGGVVRVPPGQFRFDGRISIPQGAALEGSWRGPHWPDVRKGTMLLVYAGRDQEDSDPFVTMAEESTLKGLSFYYPEQKVKEVHPYPWTVSVRGSRINVIDVAMAYTYNGLDCGTHYNGAHLLRNINMGALRRGVFVDKVSDIGRMENIHIHDGDLSYTNRQLRDSEKVDFGRYTVANLEGFIIGRCDWSYMVDCFVIAAKLGFRFVPGKDPGQAPAANILITQSGSDLGPLGVKIERVQDHAGIAFENCQFMNSIEIDEANTGPLKLVNCGFWGQCRTGRMILNKGTGEVMLTACHFSAWEDRNRPYQWDPEIPFIECENGSLIMTACVFKDYRHTPKSHVRLGPNASAVLMGNMVQGGKLSLDNQSKGDVQVFGTISKA
jgi:hypothetical protein